MKLAQYITTDYGGNPSVRIPDNTKMLFSFGHDEAIFNKNVFPAKVWAGPDGEFKILPKEDGCGVMVSALVSREFGWGHKDLTTEELKKVNEFRKNTRPNYADEEAAKYVFGSSKKEDLPDFKEKNPFVRYFLYGSSSSKDGYWSYEHLAVQLEDCLDVLQCLYKDQFDIKINVDHSCGHDRQKEDALNVNQMNRDYGGRKPKMHDSKMSEGCLENHELLPRHSSFKLKVDDVQKLVWGEAHHGPYMMPDEEREELRNGDMIGRKYVNKNKNELIRSMIESPLFPEYSSNLQLATKTPFDLRQMCIERNLNWKKIKTVEVNVIEKNKTIKELKKEIEEKTGQAVLRSLNLPGIQPYSNKDD